MTDLLTRPPNSQGMPDFSEQATKMQDQHRSMFMTDGAITADMGPALARSAEGEAAARNDLPSDRSEEHTSELQSLMRSSYAVFCLKKKKPIQQTTQHHDT